MTALFNVYLTRIAAFLPNKPVGNQEIEAVLGMAGEVNAELDDKFAQISTYLGRDMWQETYLNRQGSEVARPNSVQHSVPAWLIFGMFFIMIPPSNVIAMERQTNTLTRLNMARAPAASLLAAQNDSVFPHQPIAVCRHAGAGLLGAA